MKTFLVPALALLNAALALDISGANYEIAWFTVDGGGSTGAGGQFSIEGTIGQTDAGTSFGNRYTLEGGFWNSASSWNEELAPRLSISFVGGNVLVSWPAPATGYLLEWSSNLGASVWTATSFPYSTSATHISRSEPLAQGDRYYRLRK